MANRRRCNQIRSCHPRESASIRGTKPRARRRPLFCTKQSACVRIKPSSNERYTSPSTRSWCSIVKKRGSRASVHVMVTRWSIGIYRPDATTNTEPHRLNTTKVTTKKRCASWCTRCDSIVERRRICKKSRGSANNRIAVTRTMNGPVRQKL